MKLNLFITVAVSVSAVISINVPDPEINRKSDYSAITISAQSLFGIKYQYSTDGEDSDEWKDYTEPFTPKQSGIIYARSKFFIYESYPSVSRDVYVAENGLVYFSAAEKPGETIVSIKADYICREASENKTAGNHYVAYEITKSDIKAVGTDLNGNEKEITDFTFSPKTIKSGKNDIKIEYFITDDIAIEAHLYINGDDPEMIKLDAKYTGGDFYLGDTLDNDDFIVNGVYEDGSIKALSEYSISYSDIKEGENEITITKGSLTDTVEITAVQPGTIFGSESESNDSLKTADEINVNKTYSGRLQNEEDVDYYKLRLDSKGKLSIKFTHPKFDEDRTFWTISLLSQNEDLQYELDSNGQAAETTSPNMRLNSGTYYIKVTGDNYSSEKYSFTISFEEENDSYETEPNDNLSTQATSINTGKKYTGNIDSEDDIDYYRFTITEKSKVWIDFSHTKISESGTLWKISLFNDYNGSLIEMDSTGETARLSSDRLRLPVGNYYIKISGYHWSDFDYTFCVNSQTEGSEAESEPDDDHVTATPISFNSPVTGNLQSENDIDFYRFDLGSSTNIKISFNHSRFDDNGTFWKFELHSTNEDEALKNSEDENTISISGNSADNVSSVWYSIPAGTYYIKVFANHYNNSDYKLTLSY